MPAVPLDPQRDLASVGGHVVSVGVDLTHVSDVRESVERFGERYLQRLFTPQELADCFESADPIPRLAARFAAKEATIKALKVEGAQPPWTSMEVKRHAAGWCDEMRLVGSAARLAARRGIGRLLVSLSHEDDAAVAVVVATKGPASVPGPARAGDRPLRIGFVNNMPDAAFEETYRQFAGLLHASPDGPNTLTCYVIASVPRDAAALRSTDVHYRDHSELFTDPPDALVVTGTEPRHADLTSEPYWEDLAALLVWAERSVPAVLLSCLASHAAALAIDGIRREPLGAKRSGVYRQSVATDDPLSRGISRPVVLPHSRANGVPPGALAGSGYRIVMRSEDDPVEWSVAARERQGRLLVLLQGHPEYATTALLKEYRRDVRRYLDGSMPDHPRMPEGYLDADGAALLAEYRRRCLHGSGQRFPYQAAAEHISATWDHVSAVLFANWLAEARSRVGLTVG